MIGTFAAVLIFTMFKELYEDIGRMRSDNEVNNSTTLVLVDGQLKERKWAEVCVGDIIKVEKDKEFPADLLLVSTLPDRDTVFVDTMNLDGEVGTAVFLAGLLIIICTPPM